MKRSLNRRLHSAIAAVACATLLLAAAACGEADEEGLGAGEVATPEPTATTIVTPTATASPTEGTTTMPEPSPSPQNLPQPVALALERAAERAEVTPDEVELVEYEAVEWRDSSLGCPQPGMFYAQVISPGYRVIVEVNGETIEYHTDMGTTVIPCNAA